MNAIIEQYKIGDYIRSKFSGYYFKIINIPAKNYFKIKSMHRPFEFTLHIDEISERFVKVDIFYLGELSQKLLSEIRDGLARNKRFLAQVEKGILPN